MTRAELQEAVRYALEDTRREAPNATDGYIAQRVTAAVAKVLVWDVLTTMTTAERRAVGDELRD